MGILVDFYHFVTFILSHIHVVTVVDFYFSNIFVIFYYDRLILCICIPCLPIYNFYIPHIATKNETWNHISTSAAIHMFCKF